VIRPILLTVLLVAPTASATDVTPELKAGVDRIIASAMSGNNAFTRLTELCDDIGARLSGSTELEKAVVWALDVLKKDGHENVRGEKVMVPKWVRGDESLEMVLPRRQRFSILGLGGSVGTPGITAEVVVANDEEDLKRLGDKVKGRIVLFNNAMPPFHPVHGTHYGKTVRFRVHGARLAAKQGAVAVLVRSVTAMSLYTAHTGVMKYGDAPVKIPAAAVTVEDADLMARLITRKRSVKVTLKMEAKDHGLVESANVVAELRGRENPEEIVVIGGHLDSWDVGTGAHDDGSGCLMAMEALSVLRRLGMRPRRTIRVVLFTNEENGLRGGKQYREDHAADMKHHVAAIEADSGSFQPRGFRLDIKDQARSEKSLKRLQALVGLLGATGASETRASFAGADISPMKKDGVALLGLWMDRSKYFNVHHTRADTIDKIDPELLDKNVAMMAAIAWLLAEMPARL
jgi:carboxypeptidase Q